MTISIVLFLLVSLAFSDITCLPTEVFVKFSALSKKYASEQSFVVKDGTSILYRSPTLVENQLRILEICLTASTNNQYTLELIDKYGDSWVAGSWLKVEGEYRNAVFKNYLNNKSLDIYRLSLYMPIKKHNNWMMISGTVTDAWKDYAYLAEGWSEVTLGSVTMAASGTQYFRKMFTGITEMAAYELRLKYSFGVVAYINAVEVYRDNMPDGEVVSTTEATGSYLDLDYHGVIRPGKEVSSSQSILAVELHWLPNEEQTTVNFDAFLALMAPTALDTQCFIVADNVTISSNSGYHPENVFNFDRSDFYSVNSMSTASIVTYEFSGSVPYINGLRIWPYSSPSKQPSYFTWAGSNAVSSTDDWTTIITASGALYSSSQFKIFNGFFSSGLFKKYKATITSTGSGSLSIFEMQPMVCSVGIPTDIAFTKTTYTFYAKYEPVNIRPIVEEFTGCTIANLPDGLVIDDVTCTVSGVMMEAHPATTYTMISIHDGITYSGSFSLQIVECVGTLTQILRTYQNSAERETFVIKDSTTDAVVLSVAENSGQTSSQDWVTVLCLSGSKYSITMDSSQANWFSQSFLYVNAIISGDDMETIARITYNLLLGLSSTYSISINYAISPSSQWYYKMSSIPATWTDSSVTGWEVASATFPQPTNQLQFYKKQFDITSLIDVAGFVISIRYKYGCLVYINGNEVFRNGVVGDITTASAADTLYEEIIFRQISLPMRTIAKDSIPSIDILHQGSNTIAIALVAISATQTSVDFNCALRLMGEEAESRSYDMSLQGSQVSGYLTIFNNYHTNSAYYSACSSNYISITFRNDRRETITSIAFQLHYKQNSQHVRKFSVLARNKSTDEWTLITTVAGLVWSLEGQNKKIWLENSKPWNQYRFKDFSTGTTDCFWRFGRIDLLIDNTAIDVPALSYLPTTVYQDIEMGEVYPSSNLYTSFSVSPDLPDGLGIDTTSGVIAGTPKAKQAISIYTITANKITGGITTTTISISVDICFDGSNLISLVARTDYWSEFASYKVFRGKGVDGPIAGSIDRFMLSSALNYGDFCFPHDIYTLQLRGRSISGWANPAGYYLTVDLGTMIFEMGQVPAAPSAPSLVTTMFSTYMPFQINFDHWKVWSSIDAVPDAWKDASFDDNSWREIKALEIGSSEAVTVYIRKSMNIPSIDDYQVLNIRMRYGGGVAVHFNGRLVGRFNLEQDFNSMSEGLEPAHDPTIFVKFHILLVTCGGVTGKNVISFEIHRQKGQQSSIPVAFDATGVFGVNQCSPVVDTFTQLEGSVVESTTLDGLFDLNPVTFGTQPNEVDTFNEWTVANLEGSKFNSFAMHTSKASTSYGFSLYGRKVPEIEGEEEKTYEVILEAIDVKTLVRERSAWDAPLAVIGFRQMRFSVDETANTEVSVSSYIMQYCKASGNYCHGIDDYPAVGNGQMSPGPCEYGFNGYSFRICTEGIFGAIQSTKCTYKEPLRLTYLSPVYRFVKGVLSQTDKPSYDNIISKFELDTNILLPDGLILDPLTGIISGIPTITSDIKAFNIYGSNPKGAVSTSISISIRKGECKAEGIFQTTPVDDVAIYKCSIQGNYVGTQSRPCVLGKEDGEWKEINGLCIPIFIIVILIVVVILITIVIILIVIKSTRRARAIGGVKSKKSVLTSKKTVDKKKSCKTVKV